MSGGIIIYYSNDRNPYNVIREKIILCTHNMLSAAYGIHNDNIIIVYMNIKSYNNILYTLIIIKYVCKLHVGKYRYLPGVEHYRKHVSIYLIIHTHTHTHMNKYYNICISILKIYITHIL